MSALKSQHPVAALNINATTKAVYAFDAPANTHTWLLFETFGKDATGGGLMIIEIRERGTDDGTKSAAITAVNDDRIDTAAPLGSGYTYSVQPTNDGTMLRRATMRSDRSHAFAAFLMRAGKKYSVFITTTTNFDVQVCARIEQ